MSFIKYIFALIGAGMLVGAFFLFTGTQDFLKTAKTTQGTVVDLISSRSSDSVTYAPLIEFNTTDNSRIEFVSSNSSSPPSYSRGESVEVLYQESSPESAKINSFFSLWLGTIIVGVLGLIFFLIGMSIIIFGVSKSKMIKQLKATGTPILANFQSVQKNTSYEVNGKNPYQIITQWQNPNTSEIHVFKSENIWFDPTMHIESDKISVLIDSQDPKKYFMDISFLPKMA